MGLFCDEGFLALGSANIGARRSYDHPDSVAGFDVQGSYSLTHAGREVLC